MVKDHILGLRMSNMKFKGGVRVCRVNDIFWFGHAAVIRHGLALTGPELCMHRVEMPISVSMGMA